MDHDNGLVVAYILDGKGGGRPIGWEELRQWSPEQGILWAHFDRTIEQAVSYLSELSELDPVVVDALLELETRPRAMQTSQGLLVVLRGVNMNPGANPEDMVAIRIWVDGKRIISVRRRKLLSITDMRNKIDAGNGPTTVGEFLVDLSDCMVERMATVIEDIDDAVDDLEEKVITMESHQLRSRIARIRREAISLRRYLAPQRDAISRLYNEKVEWLNDRDRMRLREIADRTTRFVEDLDSARERAAVTQEELMGRLSEQMDKRMYLLSLVAAVFLPLGFLTGLLGINVGGIPGAEFPWAFAIVTAGLITLVAIQVIVFKAKKWM
ncbi:zinc transporter ZntB [Kaarinaea lacus]